MRKETEPISSPSLTPDERAIVQRTLNQDTDWHTIREDELTDFRLSDDPFRLPDIALKMQNDKKYAFRWCERTVERIDELTRTAPVYKRWTLATRSTLPQLANDVDSILGCVCRGDQALLFRPWHLHEFERNMKIELAEAKYKASSMEGRKNKIENSRDGYNVSIGESAKITGKDEVMYDSGGDLGDLVVDE